MKVIAGPCMAEDPVMIQEVASELKEAMEKLPGVEYYFKASYDKANRTSISSKRGPGLIQGLKWLQDVKDKVGVKVVTDIHDRWECMFAAAIVDVLQIPAMLCRQTDLVVAASKTPCEINIKKGQFLSPYAMRAIADKAGREIKDGSVWLCERGTSFGYSDLVVDMRNFEIMYDTGYPVIYDITHSMQQPPHGERMKSDALRRFAPTVARAAVATGYLDGIFLEVHPNPNKALSDGPCMLKPAEAIKLITELYYLREYVNGN